MMNQRGFFLVLESIDGAGKSTVVSELKKLYPDAIYLAEPYSTDLGKHIHEFCKAHWNELDDVTKGLLYTTQRREHLLHVVLPALEQGKLVVSERSYISTLVYQDDESVVSLHYDYIDPILEEYDLYPDLVVLLDIPAEVSLERTKQRGTDVIEDSQTVQYLEEIRAKYRAVVREENSYAIIDATQPIEKVIEDIISARDEAYL